MNITQRNKDCFVLLLNPFVQMIVNFLKKHTKYIQPYKEFIWKRDHPNSHSKYEMNRFFKKVDRSIIRFHIHDVLSKMIDTSYFKLIKIQHPDNYYYFSYGFSIKDLPTLNLMQLCETLSKKPMICSPKDWKLDQGDIKNGGYLSWSETGYDLPIFDKAVHLKVDILYSKTYLEKIKHYDASLIDLLWDICYQSRRWEKWVGDDFAPEEQKEELIKLEKELITPQSSGAISKQHYSEYKRRKL